MPTSHRRIRYAGYRTAAVLASLAVAVGAMAPDRAAAFGDATEPATYDNALALIGGGDHRAAIVELKRLLKSEPDHGAARLLVGRALVGVGLGHSAEEQLLRAAALGADADKLAPALARSYLLQGKFADLLEQFPPGDRPPHVAATLASLRGQAHFALHQYDEADHAFATTLAHEPDRVGALLGRIRVRLATLRLVKAKRLADDVVALAPTAPDLWYLKGEIARRQGDAVGAVAAYGKALAIAASHVPARIARAAILIDQARLEEATADLDAVRAIVPSDHQSALLHALILARTYRAADARSAVDRLASAIDRENRDRREKGPSRILLAGVVSHSRGALDESLHALGRYIELAPQHAGARALVGGILAQRGDLAGAIATLRPALASAPEDTRLLGLLGGFLMRAGRHGEAIPAIEAALGHASGSRILERQLTLSRLAAGGSVAMGPALDDLLSAIGPARGGVLIGLLQLGKSRFVGALDTARSIAVQRPGSPLAQNLAGIARLRQGDREKAREHFRQARALDSAYVPAIHNLASIANDPEAARELYREASKSAPEDLDAMIELAAIAERAGDLTTAIGWLVRAHEQDESRASVTLALSDLYLRAGRTREAITLVAPLDRRRRGDKRILEAAAKAHMAAGDTASAIRLYREVSRAETGIAGELNRIARVQRRLGDTKGAIFTLKTAMAVDVRDHEARDGVLELDVPSGGIDRQLVYAETLRQRYPNSGIGHVVAGNAWMRASRFGKAADAYGAALRIDPRTETVMHRFRALERAGEQESGLRILERWIAGRPSDHAARRALALASIRAGRLRRAKELHDQLVAEMPNDAVVLNNLAWLSARLGDEQALSFARRAHALRPLDPAVFDTYAMILIERGEAEGGLKLLRRAQGQRAGDARLHYHVAVALSRLGRPAEARAEVEAALRSDGSFAEASEARRLLRGLGGA